MSVLRTAISAAKAAGIDTRRIYTGLSARSLEAAIREQGLAPLRDRLREIVPDIGDQYSYDLEATELEAFWEPKMRGLHAFQIDCLRQAIDGTNGEDPSPISVADIGDSSGNHLRYLRALLPADRLGRAISVNLDPVAVDKIRARGGEALLARAEEMSLEGEPFDVAVSFEMMEHLTDPARFLYNLARSGAAKRFVMTVPFVRNSRVGLQFLRSGAPLPARVTAEQVHIFELSPDDWKLLCRFAGWRVDFQRIYYQYPRKSPLRLTAGLWKRLDFEGFLCLALVPDTGIADRYADW